MLSAVISLTLCFYLHSWSCEHHDINCLHITFQLFDRPFISERHQIIFLYYYYSLFFKGIITLVIIVNVYCSTWNERAFCYGDWPSIINDSSDHNSTFRRSHEIRWVQCTSSFRWRLQSCRTAGYPSRSVSLPRNLDQETWSSHHVWNRHWVVQWAGYQWSIQSSNQHR